MEVRNVKRAAGVERIYLPGEREQLLAEDCRRSGIPMPPTVLAELRDFGQQFGLNL